MALDAFRCFEGSIKKVRADAEQAGVQWSQVQAKSDLDGHLTILLQSSSREALELTENAMHGCVECEALSDPALQSPSVSRSVWKSYVADLMATARTIRLCVRGNVMTREIWVYGEADSRREAMHNLKASMLPQVTAADDVCCDVCRAQVKSTFVKLTSCSHIVCLTCAGTAINVPRRLPMHCPVEICSVKIHVSDVFKVAKDVAELVRMAVFMYVTDHPDKCAVCPKHGCNQLLAVPDGETPSTQFTACESCNGVYCLVCSDCTGQAVQAHVGVNCTDHLLDGPYSAQTYH